MNRFVQVYLHIVVRFPKICLSILLFITAALGLGLAQLHFNPSIEAFMPKGDPDYVKYMHTKEIYGDNDRFLILAVSGTPLWSPRTLERMNDLLCDLEEVEEFDADREDERIAHLTDVARVPQVTRADLQDAFADDPGYLRFIDRLLPEAQTGIIGARDFRWLGAEARRIRDLKAQQRIDTILSPFTASDISGGGDALETYDLVEKNESGERNIPKTADAISEFRRGLELNPAFRKGIYAVDPKTGETTDFAFIVKFNDNSDSVIAELITIAQSFKDLRVIGSGVPYVNHHFNKYMESDLYRNIPLVLIVVTLIFYFNFRSMRGVLLPLMTLGMAEIWTLGLMGHFGIAVTTVGVTLPPLLMAVGSSYSIHVLNQYYTEFARIDPKHYRRDIQAAMVHISTTVILAGLTTFAAFMTLLSSQVSAIREWGIFSGIGMIFAVFISITLIPAILVMLPHKYPAALTRGKTRKTTIIDHALALMARWAVYHYKKVLSVALVVIIISAIGMTRLQVDTEFLHYFKPSDPTRINAETVGEKFGGGWGFGIIIDSGKPDGIKSANFLHTVEQVRDWLVSDENPDLNIGRTDGFPDFIKRMHMAMNDDDPAYFKIPDDDMTVLDYLEIFSADDEDSDGRVDAFEPFVDPAFRNTNILVRLTRKGSERIGTKQIAHIIEKTNDHLERTLPAEYAFTITGYPVVNLKLAHYVVTGQMMGLFLSFGFVFIVIVLLYRRLMAGPLALVDMGVTIIINFGIMGWFGIDLDMVTSIIAAITIGIGVDDTIHFLNTYRFYREDNWSVPETIEKAMFSSGKAILFTSLALTCGFLVQVTSNFMPIILFALLISITMINTTIGSILLIPAVIRLTGIDLNRQPGVHANKGKQMASVVEN